MRRLAAQWLERGALDVPIARALEQVAARGLAGRLARPTQVPAGLEVLAVGGATLGGSGKTPLAVACVRALAEAGVEVAYVGHAYGARPRRARVVRGGDPLEEVGDEALAVRAALASLRGPSVDVVVAPTRDAALAFARRRGARVAVVDGPVQLAPRATLAWLAVDAAAPWGLARGGAGACPPVGDLRAPREALERACDRVVEVPSITRPVARVLADGSEGRAAPRVERRVEGPAEARDRAEVPLAELAPFRLGLFTALARPARLLAALAVHGVHPAVTWHAGDHGLGLGVPTARTFRHLAVHATSFARMPGSEVDAWLMTDKCALHAARIPGPWRGRAPRFVVDHGYVLPRDLEAHLVRTLCAKTPGEMPGEMPVRLDRPRAQQ